MFSTLEKIWELHLLVMGIGFQKYSQNVHIPQKTNNFKGKK